jgi:uncharacterized integral membrane protein
MIRKFLTTIFLIALTVVIAMLAVANRHWVKISIDPFSADQPAFVQPAPLYAVILGSLILGVMIGGIATWLRQRKWRRAARRGEAELRKLRAEMLAMQPHVDEMGSLPQPGRLPVATYHRPPAA